MARTLLEILKTTLLGGLVGKEVPSRRTVFAYLLGVIVLLLAPVFATARRKRPEKREGRCRPAPTSSTRARSSSRATTRSGVPPWVRASRAK